VLPGCTASFTLELQHEDSRSNIPVNCNRLPFKNKKPSHHRLTILRPVLERFGAALNDSKTCLSIGYI
jgi:hypothetical protein